MRDGAVKGINVKNRKGVEYEFNNDEEYKMSVELDKLAPYPDIPAEAPGMLMEPEEEYGVDKVVQDKPEESNEQQAIIRKITLDWIYCPYLQRQPEER